MMAIGLSAVCGACSPTFPSTHSQWRPSETEQSTRPATAILLRQQETTVNEADASQD